MKFKYLDSVVILDGFYETYCGEVVRYSERGSGWSIKRRYLVNLNGINTTEWVEEKHLKPMPALKRKQFQLHRG